MTDGLRRFHSSIGLVGVTLALKREINDVNRLLVAAPFAGLLLTACQPAEHKIGATPVRLDCPAVQGDLRRVDQAADGRACEYRSGRTEVSLRLTPVSGDPEATLAGLEANLRKLKPLTPRPVADPETPPAPPEAGAPVPPAPPEPPVRGDHDRVDIDMPGFHINADDSGAKVRIAGVHIDANDNGAEIRRVAYSRLPGEQLSLEKRGVKAFFLLAGEPSGPEGYTVVGYEASGPRKGPLTVAVVRSRDTDDTDEGDLFGKDVNALLKRNGG
jgi:hypothetical protein